MVLLDEILAIIADEYISPDTYTIACLVSKTWREKAIGIFRTQEVMGHFHSGISSFSAQIGKFKFEKNLHPEWKSTVFKLSILHANGTEYIAWRWQSTDCMYVIIEFEYRSQIPACQFLHSVMLGMNQLIGPCFDQFTEDNPEIYCCCGNCINVFSPRWCSMRSIAPQISSMEKCDDKWKVGIRHKKVHSGDFIIGTATVNTCLLYTSPSPRD